MLLQNQCPKSHPLLIMTLISKALKPNKNNIKLKFTSDNGEDYNELFSLDELLTSLNKAKDTAVGPDDIHYQL